MTTDSASALSSGDVKTNQTYGQIEELGSKVIADPVRICNAAARHSESFFRLAAPTSSWLLLSSNNCVVFHLFACISFWPLLQFAPRHFLRCRKNISGKR
jgi:hypothetical protein